MFFAIFFGILFALIVYNYIFPHILYILKKRSFWRGVGYVSLVCFSIILIVLIVSERQDKKRALEFAQHEAIVRNTVDKIYKQGETIDQAITNGELSNKDKYDASVYYEEKVKAFQEDCLTQPYTDHSPC